MRRFQFEALRAATIAMSTILNAQTGQATATGRRSNAMQFRNGIAVRITSMQEESANPWFCATYLALAGAALDPYPFSPACCERILTKLVRKWRNVSVRRTYAKT
jgi:hypothetical protein